MSIIKESKLIISKKGFTLIELLVSVGVFVIIAVVGSNLFFTILKGSGKTKILTEVKQNGDFAISVMERMIRNARKVSGDCTNRMGSLEIENPDGQTTTFEFCGGPDNLVASKSGVMNCSDGRLTNNKVRLVSGTFNCDPGDKLKPAVVVVDFILSQTGSPSRPEEQATINFRTTVTLRNY